MNFEVLNYPWAHGYSDNFVNDEFANQMEKDFPDWDSDVWDKYGKVFKSEYGYKKELTDKSFIPNSILNFLNLLESEEFVSKISDATGIKDLFIDDGLYGGGLNVYPPGSHLTTHIDFNYNSTIEAYRSVNLLYYFNKDYVENDGGSFDLYDSDMEKRKVVYPKLNTCIFFATNDKTFHGVSKTNNNFYRKSLSIWYYTKEPSEDTSRQPHKTFWIN